MTRRRTTLIPATLAAVALLSLAALGQQKEKPKLGFKDTPMLPGGKWHVHDGDRPQPPIVTPGSAAGPGSVRRRGPLRRQGPLEVARQRPGAGLEARRGRDGRSPLRRQGSGTITSKDEFGDCQIHVEFATPNPPKGTDQGRGNSGVLIMGRYELQVLDSFDNLTYPDGQASAIYGQHPPQVNASKKPGEWQTYDIIFTAPKFAKDGSLEAPAYITALHNGVLTQNHVALLGPMTFRALAKYSPHGPKGPIAFQDHGNPVRYRNIWVREIKDPE